MKSCIGLMLLAVVACKSETAPAASKDKPVEPETRKLSGVWPDRFKCDSIATTEELSQLLGGAVKQIDNPASVPKGVAHPCVYQVGTDAMTDAGAPVYVVWTFDFDCRPTYKRTADALFAQYRQRNADMVADYDRLSDAGTLPTRDAGPAPVRPGEATEVDVGAKGLDHHGQGLIFIDDDAPCYVRIAGADGPRRLALAQLIAKNLTYDNAPMEPHLKK